MVPLLPFCLRVCLVGSQCLMAHGDTLGNVVKSVSGASHRTRHTGGSRTLRPPSTSDAFSLRAQKE